MALLNLSQGQLHGYYLWHLIRITGQLSTTQEDEFSDLCHAAQNEDNVDYSIQDGVLFSCKRPGPRQAQYPRVVLPKQWRNSVIGRCHQQTGHAGRWKTTRAVLESYMWIGL